MHMQWGSRHSLAVACLVSFWLVPARPSVRPSSRSGSRPGPFACTSVRPSVPRLVHSLPHAWPVKLFACRSMLDFKFSANMMGFNS